MAAKQSNDSNNKYKRKQMGTVVIDLEILDSRSVCYAQLIFTDLMTKVMIFMILFIWISRKYLVKRLLTELEAHGMEGQEISWITNSQEWG